MKTSFSPHTKFEPRPEAEPGSTKKTDARAPDFDHFDHTLKSAKASPLKELTKAGISDLQSSLANRHRTVVADIINNPGRVAEMRAQLKAADDQFGSSKLNPIRYFNQAFRKDSTDYKLNDARYQLDRLDSNSQYWASRAKTFKSSLPKLMREIEQPSETGIAEAISLPNPQLGLNKSKKAQSSFKEKTLQELDRLLLMRALRQQAKPEALAKEQNKLSDTLYDAVFSNRSPEILRELINAGADPTFTQQFDPRLGPQYGGGMKNVSLLHVLAELPDWQGKADRFQTLLNHGARLDAQDANGDTPLHQLARRSSPESEALWNFLQTRPEFKDASTVKNSLGKTAEEVRDEAKRAPSQS